MRTNILLTGMPRSGKSTLLERIVSEQQNKVGLLTREIRENGERTGFAAINHLGESTIIASTEMRTSIKVSRYFVDVKKINEIIPSLISYDNHLLYIDEIGNMQLHSEPFMHLAKQYLDSQNVCLATISQVYEHPFIAETMKRKDSILINIDPENREEKYQFVKKLIGKMHKARRYATETERFIVSPTNIQIRTDHGEKHLTRIDKGWLCDCDFYTANKICSHTLAVELLDQQ